MAGPHPPLALRPLDTRGLRLLLRQRLAVNGAPARGALHTGAAGGGNSLLPLLIFLISTELRSFDVPLRRLVIISHGAAEQQQLGAEPDRSRARPQAVGAISTPSAILTQGL